LTVENGAGDFSFSHAVGGNTRLGALGIRSSGATQLGAAARAASVSTDAAGTLALNGGTVDTTGAQTYGERAVLGGGHHKGGPADAHTLSEPRKPLAA
jgi:hypothetical protein